MVICPEIVEVHPNLRVSWRLASVSEVSPLSPGKISCWGGAFFFVYAVVQYQHIGVEANIGDFLR